MCHLTTQLKVMDILMPLSFTGGTSVCTISTYKTVTVPYNHSMEAHKIMQNVIYTQHKCLCPSLRMFCYPSYSHANNIVVA